VTGRKNDRSYYKYEMLQNSAAIITTLALSFAITNDPIDYGSAAFIAGIFYIVFSLLPNLCWHCLGLDELCRNED